jgi:hypothetical protein
VRGKGIVEVDEIDSRGGAVMMAMPLLINLIDQRLQLAHTSHRLTTALDSDTFIATTLVSHSAHITYPARLSASFKHLIERSPH